MTKENALTGSARERLFSRVASMRKPEIAETFEPAVEGGAASRFTDFSTLPGYDELRLQRMIGEKLEPGKSVFPDARGTPRHPNAH